MCTKLNRKIETFQHKLWNFKLKYLEDGVKYYKFMLCGKVVKISTTSSFSSKWHYPSGIML